MTENPPPNRRPAKASAQPGVTAIHAWERWAPAWHWLFYGVLVLATGAALGDASTSDAARTGIVVMSVALAGWYGFWALRRRIWDLRRPQVLVYFAGAATLWVLLEQLNEAYFLVAFAAYPQVFAFLPGSRSAIRGSVVLTALMIAMTITESGELPWLTVVLAVLSVGVGVGMTLFVDAIMRESQERHRLIAELESTRRDLAAAERESGVLEERQRLAREIHDTLAQGFTSIVMLLEAAEAGLGPGQGAARTQLDQARRTARESLAEARGVVWSLQPHALADATLPVALARLAEHLQEETEVGARSMVTGVQRQRRDAHFGIRRGGSTHVQHAVAEHGHRSYLPGSMPGAGSVRTSEHGYHPSG